MKTAVPLIETPEGLAKWIVDANTVHDLKGKQRPAEYSVPVISFDTGVGFEQCSPEEIVYLQDAGEHLLALFGFLLMRVFSGVCESWEGGGDPKPRLQLIADGLKRTMEEYEAWG